MAVANALARLRLLRATRCGARLARAPTSTAAAPARARRVGARGNLAARGDRARCAGRARGAAAALERSLDLAEPAGLRRLIVDTARLVGRCCTDTPATGPRIRALVSENAGDDRACGSERSRPIAVLLAEPLSEREQAILRYLPTMMSNHEIAGELFVSVNTVKTHLKAIYRKLDASGRREAVQRGRELGLMP